MSENTTKHCVHFRQLNEATATHWLKQILQEQVINDVDEVIHRRVHRHGDLGGLDGLKNLL